MHRAGRTSLVPFADGVAARIAPTVALVADPSLSETDLLVLAYRLGRPLPRVEPGAPCIPGRHRLVSPRPGSPVVSPLLVSERRGVPVALVADGSCDR